MSCSGTVENFFSKFLNFFLKNKNYMALCFYFE